MYQSELVDATRLIALCHSIKLSRQMVPISTQTCCWIASLVLLARKHDAGQLSFSLAVVVQQFCWPIVQSVFSLNFRPAPNQEAISSVGLEDH